MKERVCAYARKEEAKVVLVAVPRFLAHLVQMDEMPFGKKTWGIHGYIVAMITMAQSFRLR